MEWHGTAMELRGTSRLSNGMAERRWATAARGVNMLWNGMAGQRLATQGHGKATECDATTGNSMANHRRLREATAQHRMQSKGKAKRSVASQRQRIAKQRTEIEKGVDRRRMQHGGSEDLHPDAGCAGAA